MSETGSIPDPESGLESGKIESQHGCSKLEPSRGDIEPEIMAKVDEPFLLRIEDLSDPRETLLGLLARLRMASVPSPSGVEDGPTPVTESFVAGAVSDGTSTPASLEESVPGLAHGGSRENAEPSLPETFLDAGDGILLLGDLVSEEEVLASQGLRGSLYLKLAGADDGAICCQSDEGREAEVRLAVRSLGLGGAIKSVRECGAGGLAVAVAACCGALGERPGGIGAEVDLSAWDDLRRDVLFFGESQRRFVVSVGEWRVAKVLAQAKILGVPAAVIGRVGGDRLAIRGRTSEWTWTLGELGIRDLVPSATPLTPGENVVGG